MNLTKNHIVTATQIRVCKRAAGIDVKVTREFQKGKLSSRTGGRIYQRLLYIFISKCQP